MPSKGAIVWLTGLSGAGKSTLATALEQRLRTRRPVELLDGDELRMYVSERLGYSREDRDRNVHRIAYIGRLLAKHGVLVIAAVISPYAETREAARALSEKAGHDFLEIYVNAPLETVVERDVKGLYKRALAGEIERFTGVSDPYEVPPSPALEVRTDLDSEAECVERILALLARRELV